MLSKNLCVSAVVSSCDEKSVILSKFSMKVRFMKSLQNMVFEILMIFIKNFVEAEMTSHLLSDKCHVSKTSFVRC